MKTLKLTLFVTSVFLLIYSCGGDSTPTPDFNETPSSTTTDETPEATPVVESADPMLNKGVGPITSVTLSDEIDQALVESGIEVYKANCTACHKMEKRVVGPALKGITERRSPEWIMNMIMDPEGMVVNDPIAKALLAEYLSPMANQNITEEEARAILEFLRTKN